MTPFKTVTPAMKAAFDAKVKGDLLALGRDLLGAGAEHLRDNPTSTLTQALRAVERDTGAITTFVRVAKAYAADAAAKRPKSSASSPPPDVVDGEFDD